MKIFKKGDTLSVINDIITIGGKIILAKDQTVKIERVFKRDGFVANTRWYPDKITGFKIEGEEGIFSTASFKETKDI